MSEEKKDVWSKVKGKVPEVLSAKKYTVEELAALQLNVQLQIKGNVAQEYPSHVAPTVISGCMLEERWQEHFRTNILAAHAELSEALDWMPWKPWRRYGPVIDVNQSVNEIQNCKLELVDTLCFLLNAWHMLGGDGQELAALHKVKCDENLARQRGGY